MNGGDLRRQHSFCRVPVRNPVTGVYLRTRRIYDDALLYYTHTYIYVYYVTYKNRPTESPPPPRVSSVSSTRHSYGFSMNTAENRSEPIRTIGLGKRIIPRIRVRYTNIISTRTTRRHVRLSAVRAFVYI